MSLSSLPIVDRSLLPADVRDAGPQRRKEYAAALGFERMLVQQLVQTLADTAKPSEEGDAATQTYRAMLPDAMADAIAAQGGLGLARDLLPAVPPTRGTSAGGTTPEAPTR
jgi:Rod binding domain-containing protein